MRKSFVLLLTVSVVASVALAAVACGEEAETDVTAGMDEGTTIEASPSALSYTEAKNNVGATDLWFTGPVLEIVDKGIKYLVVVGDTEDDVLNLAVTDEDVEVFGGADALDQLVGKTVEVTGLVEQMFDKPIYEIKLTDASQLKVVE